MIARRIVGAGIFLGIVGLVVGGAGIVTHFVSPWGMPTWLEIAATSGPFLGVAAALLVIGVPLMPDVEQCAGCRHTRPEHAPTGACGRCQCGDWVRPTARHRT